MVDAIIVGGGPAGATAAVYIARAGFAVTLIYKDFGALATAERVSNYYGIANIGGKSLVERGLRQARASGAKTLQGEVVGLSGAKGNMHVKTERGIYESKAVLLAVGASRATPQIANLADFEGRGVSYCAICDGFFYRGKNVAVLGSGAYALHEANDLLPLASSVTLLTNGSEPTTSFPANVRIRTEKISEIYGAKTEPPKIPGLINTPASAENGGITAPSPLRGEGAKPTFYMPEKIFGGVIFEGGEKLPLGGIFIAEGIAGSAELARKIGAMQDEEGSITVDSEQRTTVSGIWAAGDCTGGLKQIVKAAHEGAAAGLSIVNFLRG